MPEDTLRIQPCGKSEIQRLLFDLIAKKRRKTQEKEVDGAMEDMKNKLTEQQKKDAETFAQLPEDVSRDMKNFMAGLLAAYSRIGGADEKLAG